MPEVSQKSGMRPGHVTLSSNRCGLPPGALELKMESFTGIVEVIECAGLSEQWSQEFNYLGSVRDETWVKSGGTTEALPAVVVFIGYLRR